jgi:hypothetical protein
VPGVVLRCLGLCLQSLHTCTHACTHVSINTPHHTAPQGPAFSVANNFRFAAAGFSAPSFKPRAISIVVLCGVFAAVGLGWRLAGLMSWVGLGWYANLVFFVRQTAPLPARMATRHSTTSPGDRSRVCPPGSDGLLAGRRLPGADCNLWCVRAWSFSSSFRAASVRAALLYPKAATEIVATLSRPPHNPSRPNPRPVTVLWLFLMLLVDWKTLHRLETQEDTASMAAATAAAAASGTSTTAGSASAPAGQTPRPPPNAIAGRSPVRQLLPQASKISLAAATGGDMGPDVFRPKQFATAAAKRPPTVREHSGGVGSSGAEADDGSPRLGEGEDGGGPRGGRGAGCCGCGGGRRRGGSGKGDLRDDLSGSEGGLDEEEDEGPMMISYGELLWTEDFIVPALICGVSFCGMAAIMVRAWCVCVLHARVLRVCVFVQLNAVGGGEKLNCVRSTSVAFCADPPRLTPKHQQVNPHPSPHRTPPPVHDPSPDGGGAQARRGRGREPAERQHLGGGVPHRRHVPAR